MIDMDKLFDDALTVQIVDDYTCYVGYLKIKLVPYLAARTCVKVPKDDPFEVWVSQDVWNELMRKMGVSTKP
jgi:hypothetical protein